VALSLNKVFLIGHLGKDAETRFSSDNSIQITSFTMATSRSTRGKDGNWANETTWHNIVGFNLQDWVLQSLKKGTRAYVEGRIQIREFDRQDGTKGRVFEVIAERIQLVDKKSDSDGSSPFEAYGGGDTADSSTGGPSGYPDSEGGGEAAPSGGKKPKSREKDDLPF
jgi:single stranded DNA-binding protein (ssb)